MSEEKNDLIVKIGIAKVLLESYKAEQFKTQKRLNELVILIKDAKSNYDYWRDKLEELNKNHEGD